MCGLGLLIGLCVLVCVLHLECLSDQILQSRTTSDKQYEFAPRCISWQRCTSVHGEQYIIEASIKIKMHSHTTHIG